MRGVVPEFAETYGVSMERAVVTLVDHLLLRAPIPLDRTDPLGLAAPPFFEEPSPDAWYAFLGVTPEELEAADPQPVGDDTIRTRLGYLTGRAASDHDWWIRGATQAAFEREHVKAQRVLVKPIHTGSAGLFRCLNLLSPYYRGAQWCPDLLTRPVHRADVLIAADIIREHADVQQRDLDEAARSGRSYHRSYKFTTKDWAETRDYLLTAGLIDGPEGLDAALHAAVKAARAEVLALRKAPTDAAVIWVNWAIPRFFTAWSHEVAGRYPTVYVRSGYDRVEPTVGDDLIEQLTANHYSRPFWEGALQRAGREAWLPAALRPYMAYGERNPVSAARIVDWLKDATGFRYGDNPWAGDNGALVFRSPYHGDDNAEFRWAFKDRAGLAQLKREDVARRFWEHWIEYRQTCNRRRNGGTALGGHMLGRAMTCGLFQSGVLPGATRM